MKWLTVTANTTIPSVKEYSIAVYNTLALAYHRTSKYDSALYYYNKALAEFDNNHRTGWDGIISGNIAQLFYQQKQYDTAIVLLDKDYQTSMKLQYYDNALNSLQWSARAWAAKGNGAKAMLQLRSAMQLLDKVPEDACTLPNCA